MRISMSRRRRAGEAVPRPSIRLRKLFTPALAAALLLPGPARALDALETAKSAVEAHGGPELMAKSESYGVRRGSFTQYFPAPNKGDFVEWRSGDKVLIEVQLAGIEVVQGYDGERAWVKSFGQVIDAPDQVRISVEEELRHGFVALVDAVAGLHALEKAEPTASLDGAELRGVRVVSSSREPATEFHFDPVTGRVAKISFTDVNPYLGGQSDFETYFFDYREIEGMVFPAKAMHFIDGVQMDEVIYESVEYEVEIDDGIFEKPGDRDAPGEDLAAASDTLSVEVPLEHSMKLLFVEVAIGDGDSPHAFILDTGAGVTCLSIELAEELEVESTGDMSAAGAGGAMEAQTGRIDRLSIGDLIVDDLDVMLLDLARFSEMMGREVDGILGYNVLNRYTTTIDIAGATLLFEDSDRALPEGGDCFAVPFQVLMGIPVVEGVVDGEAELSFLIDTGATMSVLPKAVAEKLSPGRRLEGAVAAGADYRKIEMALARFEELKVGEAVVEGPVFSYPLSPEQYDPLGSTIDTAGRGVIGTEILENFEVTLNYDKAVMVLRKIERPADSTREWSGPGVMVHLENGSAFVRSVFQNGPADGVLMPGDRIVEIDGIPVEGKGLEEIVEMLKGDPGTVLEITFDRDGSSQKVAIERTKLL